MQLTLSSILYLFFRLSPFILVCFFVIGSVINSELKGFVYLIGLVFACSMCRVFSPDNSSSSEKPLICNSFSINGVYDTSSPMSLAVFSFTFFYLVFPIGKYKLAIHNIPTLIMFPLLILGEVFWILSYDCFPVLNCAIAIIVAGGIGAGWAAIIDKVKLRGLQYFNVGTNAEVCTRPSKHKFRCKSK
jgi:hypothetical protein